MFWTRGLRGKRKDGRLETRGVLRIVRTLGQRVGLHVWNHALRHSSITQAATLGQRAGLGLDKIRAHSRHKSIATLLIYVDEQDRAHTQRTLADVVAGTLKTPSLSVSVTRERSRVDRVGSLTIARGRSRLCRSI